MKQIEANIVKKLIEKIQAEHGLSAGQLAQKIDVTPEGIYRILDGRTKKVRISTITQICKIFNYKLVIENGKPEFYPLQQVQQGLSPSLQNNNEFESIIKKYAEPLGYEPTPEGLNQFLRECRGQYQVLHTIKRLLSDISHNEKSKTIDK